MAISKNPQIQMLLIKYTAYYQAQIPDSTLAMYLEDFERSGLSPEEIARGFEKYRANPKNTRMPLPAIIIDSIRPRVTAEAAADVVATKIMKAFKLHGETWHEGVWFNGAQHWPARGNHYDSFAEAIMVELGEVGMATVAMYGGWKSMAGYLDGAPDSVVIPQLRRFVESTLNLAKTGNLNEVPKLPTRDGPLMESHPERAISPETKTLRINGQDVVRNISERAKEALGGQKAIQAPVEPEPKA